MLHRFLYGTGLLPVLVCVLLLQTAASAAAQTLIERSVGEFLQPGEPLPGTFDPGRDDTPVLQRALNAGAGTVKLGPGVYRVGGLQIPTGVTLAGAGAGTILRSTGVPRVLLAQQAHDFCIRDLVIEGTASGHWHLRDDAGHSGIAVSGCYGYEIVGVTLRHFDGPALNIARTQLVDAAFSNGGRLDRIVARDNYAGIQFDTRGEYVTATHLNCHQNMRGVVVHAGNTSIATSNFCGNVDGMVLTDRENGSHGLVQGCLLNHNERYALCARDVQNGMTFSGCCFYYGAIELRAARGIQIANSQINCHVTVAGPGTNMLSSNLIIPSEYHFTFDGPTLIRENYTHRGAWTPPQP